MKYRCSACKQIFEGKVSYCPHCGKKMTFGDEPKKEVVKPTIVNKEEPINDNQKEIINRRITIKAFKILFDLLLVSSIFFYFAPFISFGMDGFLYFSGFNLSFDFKGQIINDSIYNYIMFAIFLVLALFALTGLIAFFLDLYTICNIEQYNKNSIDRLKEAIKSNNAKIKTIETMNFFTIIIVILIFILVFLINVFGVSITSGKSEYLQYIGWGSVISSLFFGIGLIGTTISSHSDAKLSIDTLKLK